MYFAIIGKNKELSLREIKIIEPINLEIQWNIIYFESTKELEISKLWGIIKWWKIIEKEEIVNEVKLTRIIWVPNMETGLKRKSEFGVKRYKIVDLFKSDKEIKKKWKEFIKLKNNKRWLVKWYQNIPLYETIDFDKPSRSMKMWMMPAKLTHILINIWISISPKSKSISDPFAWSWTTWFLVNFMGYNFLWSDLNTTHLEENIKRRKTTKFYKKDFDIDFMEQDATKTWNKVSDLIITEWWLWPMVTDSSSEKEIITYQKQVEIVYTKRLKTFTWSTLPTIITTIPFYIKKTNFLADSLSKLAQEIGFKVQTIKEIYQRPGQKVWRQVIILFPN